MPRLKNARHERFAREFVVDLNGTQAAIRTGYAKAGSRVRASKLLTKANLIARIVELQKEIEDRVGNAAAMLRTNLRLMSEVEITDIFNDDRTMKKFSEMSKGARLLISNLEAGDGVVRIKTESKLKAMEMLGRHYEVSAWEENISIHGGDDLVERMRRYQKRTGLRGLTTNIRESETNT